MMTEEQAARILAQAYRAHHIGGNAWVARNDGGYCEDRKVIFLGWGTEYICADIAEILSRNFASGRAAFMIDEIKARAAARRMDGASAYEAAQQALARARELDEEMVAA